MSRFPSLFGRSAALPCLAAAGLSLGALVASGAPALAQAAGCQDIGKTLNERRTIVERLSGLSQKGKKVEPKVACQMFTSLVSNGTTVIKFLDANKDWCQIPDTFVEGMKKDHKRAQELRGTACNAAVKQAEFEKRAKEGGGGSGLLGGDGLTGSYRVPQGAL